MEDNFNLITGLKANLKNIFSLNDCLDSNIQKCFKVLIFDDHVFEVLTPLLKVYSLREENICLHLNIKTIKEKMPNVMGIYLIEPSKQNFSLIEKDIKNLIFDNYYFVFTNTLTEEQTIDFFSLLYNGNCAEKVYKIESYPMGIMAYHSRIFSLNIKSSYHFLNSSNVKESEVNEYFKLVGSGLFNLLFTLNSIPTIKYRQGWFAENIIQELQNIFDYSFEKFPETKNKMQIQFNHKTLPINEK